MPWGRLAGPVSHGLLVSHSWSPKPEVGGSSPPLPRMPLEGEYEPSPWALVREQVEEYEASNGERANTLLDTGIPVVIVTMRGHKSGKIRKVPLMRILPLLWPRIVTMTTGMPVSRNVFGTFTIAGLVLFDLLSHQGPGAGLVLTL